MRAARLRALVVGAVTWDYDLDRPSRPPRPGGVVTFAGVAFARLGAQTRVVSRAAAADVAVFAPLRAAGVEVCALPSAATTTYANRYGAADRDGHELRTRSDPLREGDVPVAWLAAADVVQAGPLHPGDVEPAAVAGARGLVGVDLQGLVRDPALGRDAIAGAVRAWCATARVVQASAADVTALFDADSPRAIRAAYGVDELLVTDGPRGAVLATREGTTRIAATPVAGGDPRGAGDTFLAVYLAARALGMPAAAAAAAAARITAEAIRTGAVPRAALG